MPRINYIRDFCLIDILGVFELHSRTPKSRRLTRKHPRAGTFGAAGRGLRLHRNPGHRSLIACRVGPVGDVEARLELLSIDGDGWVGEPRGENQGAISFGVKGSTCFRGVTENQNNQMEASINLFRHH